MIQGVKDLVRHEGIYIEKRIFPVALHLRLFTKTPVPRRRSREHQSKKGTEPASESINLIVSILYVTERGKVSNRPGLSVILLS